MSATVAAALKKIAVAILTNPKVLKTIGGIVLGIIIIIDHAHCGCSVDLQR